MVQVLARFQVTGGNEASGVNFQAAVPKVLSFTSTIRMETYQLSFVVVSAVENAINVQLDSGTRRDGNTNAKNYRTARRTLSLFAFHSSVNLTLNNIAEPDKAAFTNFVCRRWTIRARTSRLRQLSYRINKRSTVKSLCIIIHQWT